MTKSEKVALLKTISEGKRPIKTICLLHTEEGIWDGDAEGVNSFTPGRFITESEDEHVARIKEKYPLHDIKHESISLETCLKWDDELEAEY